MTESVSSTGNLSLSALSDLKSFFRSGADISRETNESEQENKAAESRKRSYVTRNALSKLVERNSKSNAELIRRNTEEKVRNDADTTNPLKVNTPARQTQSALEINRPEVSAESNPLKVNLPDRQTQSALEINRPEVSEESNPLKVNLPDRQTQSALEINRPEVSAESNPLKVNLPARQAQSALEINRPEVSAESNPLKVNLPDSETATKPASSSIPKQKQAILYELKNTMHLKDSAWDIAKRYGISYLQAQEIFVDLNQDANGIVKEFNLPENSTVSYLV